MTNTGKSTGVASSLRKHVLIGLFIVVTLVGGLGGWASYASISGAVIAQGSVVVESNSKRVQHKEGGIVGAINVEEGQRVEASELLLTLDDTLTRASLSIVAKQLDELSARKARLVAERDGAGEIRFDANLTDRASNEEIAQAMRGERKLFEARRNTAQSQKDQLAEQVGQLQEEIKGLIAQRDAKAAELAFIAEELSGLEELYKDGNVTKTRMLALRREASRLKGEHGQFLATIARTKGRIAETKLQITQIDQNMLAEVVGELRETEARMIEFAERKFAAQDQLKRVEIRAPKTGFVHQLAVHTVGGVIAPGETVMLIVPENDQLVIEARINPTDIDQIRQGQKAIMRFPTFNQRTTPELEGSVSTVSADLSQDEHTGATFYVARLKLKAGETDKFDGKPMLPGMPAEVFVQTQARTTLNYLMKPLSDHVARVFREE